MSFAEPWYDQPATTEDHFQWSLDQQKTIKQNNQTND